MNSNGNGNVAAATSAARAHVDKLAHDGHHHHVGVVTSAADTPSAATTTTKAAAATAPLVRHHGTSELDEVLYRRSLSTRHTLRIVLRNSLYAALGRLAWGLLKLIARCGLGRRFARALPHELFSLNPLRWAAVIAGFSSFRLCMQTLMYLAAYAHVPEWCVAITSGCVCALPVVVMDRETRTNMSLYAFVRAAHTFTLRFVYPRLPARLQRFAHYDVLLMCASAAQISYAIVFAPYTMPTGYRRFLERASMHDTQYLRSYAGYVRGHTTPELVELCWRNRWPLPPDARTAPAQHVLCRYTHHGMSCNQWALFCALNNIVKVGIPLYAPLRAVLTLTLDRKRVAAHPLHALVRSVRSVLTSSLFLGLYVACLVRPFCFAMQHNIGNGVVPGLLGSIAGVATLLEPKSRRLDLGLYCSTYALRSFVLTQWRLGRLPYPRHWFVFLVYVLSTSYLFFEYEEEPRRLHSRVHAIFCFVLGEKMPSRHHHQHHHGQAVQPQQQHTPAICNNNPTQQQQHSNGHGNGHGHDHSNGNETRRQ